MRLSSRQILAWRRTMQYKQLVEQLALLEKLYEEFEDCIRSCLASEAASLDSCIIKCYEEIRKKYRHGR